MSLDVFPLTPDRWPAFEDLFGRVGASNGCWCMYWRLGPRLPPTTAHGEQTRPPRDRQRPARVRRRRRRRLVRACPTGGPGLVGQGTPSRTGGRPAGLVDSLLLRPPLP